MTKAGPLPQYPVLSLQWPFQAVSVLVVLGSLKVEAVFGSAGYCRQMAQVSTNNLLNEHILKTGRAVLKISHTGQPR